MVVAIKHIHDSGNNATLLSLQKCSKQLYDLVTPILYRKITINKKTAKSLFLSFRLSPTKSTKKRQPTSRVYSEEQIQYAKLYLALREGRRKRGDHPEDFDASSPYIDAFRTYNLRYIRHVYIEEVWKSIVDTFRSNLRQLASLLRDNEINPAPTVIKLFPQLARISVVGTVMSVRPSSWDTPISPPWLKAAWSTFAKETPLDIDICLCRRHEQFTRIDKYSRQEFWGGSQLGLPANTRSITFHGTLDANAWLPPAKPGLKCRLIYSQHMSNLVAPRW